MGKEKRHEWELPRETSTSTQIYAKKGQNQNNTGTAWHQWKEKTYCNCYGCCNSIGMDVKFGHNSRWGWTWNPTRTHERWKIKQNKKKTVRHVVKIGKHRKELLTCAKCAIALRPNNSIKVPYQNSNGIRRLCVLCFMWCTCFVMLL